MTVLSNMSRTLLLSLLIAFQSLPAPLQLVSAACPPTKCGVHGECIQDTRACIADQCEESCKCDPGYAGDDCSFEVDTCPNDLKFVPGERSCFNGGKCVPVVSTNQYGAASVEYICDCRKAVLQAKIFDGNQCEFPSERSCVSGTTFSNYAFCTNGGVCKKIVTQGEAHPGCNCVKNMEGTHCQYKAGTAPEDQVSYGSNSSSGWSGGQIFGIIALTLCFVAAVGCVVYKKAPLKANAKQQEFDTGAAVSHDLSLEEMDLKDEQEKQGEFL